MYYSIGVSENLLYGEKKNENLPLAEEPGNVVAGMHILSVVWFFLEVFFLCYCSIS